MNNNILRWTQRKRQRQRRGGMLFEEMKFEILVDWYDVVTPFGWEGQ